ncbi:MAG: ABC transporter permease [Caldilineaceae bacterium]
MTVATNTPISTLTQSHEERLAMLSVRRLMWLRFRRNKLALAGSVLLLIMYMLATFAEFFAPYTVDRTHDKYVSAPPVGLHLVDAEGNWHWPPFVYGIEAKTDPATFRRVFTPIPEERYSIDFWGHGEPYLLFGLIASDRHLFTVEDPAVIFLMGTDSTGRDLFSRILYGARISLSVGLVGVLLSLLLGAFLGVASGYFGGSIDNIVQRVIEVITSIPQIPLWLALAAAVPPNWSPVKVYFGIAIVLSFVTWGGLARQVRGIVLGLRDSDFVTAARYTNCTTFRIITQHLLPNTFSHVLVIATLSIPGMILGETALSFLGLGIRPPMTSWGVLLNEAQHVRVLLSEPWLLIPAIFVLITIISFNFVGDGLRDAADPFAGE